MQTNSRIYQSFNNSPMSVNMSIASTYPPASVEFRLKNRQVFLISTRANIAEKEEGLEYED